MQVRTDDVFGVAQWRRTNMRKHPQRREDKKSSNLGFHGEAVKQREYGFSTHCNIIEVPKKTEESSCTGVINDIDVFLELIHSIVLIALDTKVLKVKMPR